MQVETSFNWVYMKVRDVNSCLLLLSFQPSGGDGQQLFTSTSGAAAAVGKTAAAAAFVRNLPTRPQNFRGHERTFPFQVVSAQSCEEINQIGSKNL